MVSVVFRNAAGEIIADLSLGLGGVLGSVAIDLSQGATGSFQHPELAFGEPFSATIPRTFDGGVSVTFSGDTGYWQARRFGTGALDQTWRGRLYFGTT